jgi:hypothetical protein
MTRKKLYFMPVILILATLACSLPSGPESTLNGAEATITALAATIEAQNSAPTNPPATNTSPPGDTPTPTETPTSTETPTVTATYTSTIPMVSVTTGTNCRTGPGTAYDIVYSLGVGPKAELIGKYTVANYWIIKIPNGSTSCWLWGQYAQVEGDVSGLPEYTPPPTPTPAPPSAPKNLSILKACIPILPAAVFYNYAGAVKWEDTASNETGFRVYLNGNQIGTAGPDGVSAPLPGLPFPAGTQITIGVEAYNAAGKSDLKTIKMQCP